MRSQNAESRGRDVSEPVERHPSRGGLRRVLTLIGMGFTFALVGIANIGIALSRHTPIFEPLQWLCMAAFCAFILSGIVLAICEVVGHRRG